MQKVFISLRFGRGSLRRREVRSSSSLESCFEEDSGEGEGGDGGEGGGGREEEREEGGERDKETGEGGDSSYLIREEGVGLKEGGDIRKDGEGKQEGKVGRMREGDDKRSLEGGGRDEGGGRREGKV